MDNANRLSFKAEAGSGDSDGEQSWGDGENINAKWVLLKEKAATLKPAGEEDDTGLAWKAEFERRPEEREKYRKIGQKLLRVIGRLPDRLTTEEKAAKLERFSRLAENLGIGEDYAEATDVAERGVGYAQVGRETFGDDYDKMFGAYAGSEAGVAEVLTDEEKERVERLRERVIDLTEMEPGALAEKFPSGNYLFHGSTVPRIEKIFATGGLKNGVAMVEDDPEVSALNMNSGFEGVSWSMDQIDALPGTRGHLAGFLAAPEDVLTDDEKLVIPSRPAPFEVLQVGAKVNAEELYRTKVQLETWGNGGVSFAEKNTVESNLMFMLMDVKGARTLGASTVLEYKGDTSAEAMRKHFSFDEQGKVVWDENLFQKMEVPPALPWMQSLIDSGRLERSGYPELDTVDKIVEKARGDQDFILKMVATVRNDVKPLDEKYDKMLDESATAVRIAPEKMYFVTAHKDLEAWLTVMARTGVEPKGILLYDDAQVVMENFASRYGGNQEELSAEIGRAVGVDGDFWSREMGMKPLEMTRSGSVGQVILESEVRHDREIRMVDGRLEVVSGIAGAGATPSEAVHPAPSEA